MFKKAQLAQLTKERDEARASSDRLLEAHTMIVSRASKIAKPNGTTKVLARISQAAITGGDIEAAAAKAR